MGPSGCHYDYAQAVGKRRAGGVAVACRKETE